MAIDFNRKWFNCFQEGDVIELCQVSDIRAGGIPKVSELILLWNKVRIEKHIIFLWSDEMLNWIMAISLSHIENGICFYHLLSKF